MYSKGLSHQTIIFLKGERSRSFEQMCILTTRENESASKCHTLVHTQSSPTTIINTVFKRMHKEYFYGFLILKIRYSKVLAIVIICQNFMNLSKVIPLLD